MSEIKDGGPAFPVLKHYDNGHMAQVAEGMTLRDYFAAKAMQGFFYNYSAVIPNAGSNKKEAIAINAYEMADAMLKARGQE